MNNMMMQIMQMMQGGVPMNQMMQMFGGNPLMQQAMKMGQGKSPEQMMQIFNNIANEKGISMEQFEQFARMFGIKK